MLTRLDVTVAQVDEQFVRFEPMLRVPRLAWQWKGLVDAAIDRTVVLRAARQHGLEADSTEMQAAADTFRKSLGLTRADKTRAWLAERHLTLDDLQDEGRFMVLREKLAERVVDPQVDRYFHEHRGHFSQVALARVLVADENLAAELFAEVEEEETSFEDLVVRRSIDSNTAWRGGYWGDFRRRDLSGEVESAAFGAAIGAILGPFKHRDGWMLIKVLGRCEEVLDGATRRIIRETLMQSWLDEQRRTLPISYLIP